jgi:hypothetical protein
MTAAKATHFEQVPVEVVQKIVGQTAGRPPNAENARTAKRKESERSLLATRTANGRGEES